MGDNMSIRAYPIEKSYHKNYICRKTILSDSFNLWHLTSQEETLLSISNFFDQLNEDSAGFTEISAEDIETIEAEAEEIGYTGDLLDKIKSDMKEHGDGDYIEYQCF